MLNSSAISCICIFWWCNICDLQFQALMPVKTDAFISKKLRYGQVPGFDHAKVRAKES